MTIRANDLPERPADPDELPWDDRDAEIESKAADLELRMSDEAWCDLLLDALGDYLWPIGRKGADGKPCQTDMDRVRAQRLKALRNAVLAHNYSLVGEIMVDAFRGALIAKVEEDLL